MNLEINPFRMGSDKEAALKPLEEAAEIFGAYQLVERWSDTRFFGGAAPSSAIGQLAYEIADCITACVNLADRYGIDLQAALDAVERHNRERGRYGALD